MYRLYTLSNLEMHFHKVGALERNSFGQMRKYSDSQGAFTPSVLIEPWSVSWDSPVGLGWCESSFELWCGPNNRTLVRLKTWVSVRFQVHQSSVHYR